MTFQKRYLIPAVLSLLIVSGFFMWQGPINNSKPYKFHGPDPGYYEQLFEMKKNEAGVIPVGLRNLWYQSDARLYKNSSNLKGIKERGPNHVGGRTRALVIDLSDKNRVLAGSVSGGVWLSEDRGKTWKLRDDHALSLAVTAITQNPFNKKIFYYGTGESMGNSAGIDGNGVFASSDGGLTFNQLPSTNNNNFTAIWDIKHSLTDSNTFYVASNSTGLWRTNDAGETFTRIYNGGRRIHEIEVFTDSTVMFTVAGLGIFRLKEKEEKAVQLGGGLPTSGFDRISLAYCESQPLVMYAQFMNGNSTAHAGTYKTTDGGTNWTAMTNPSTGTKISYSWAWYCLDVQVHPTNPDFVLTLSVSAGYSNDGGKTWKDLTNTHADYHTARFFSGENNYLVGNDGGIYQYNINNLQSGIIDLNKGYNVTQFYTGDYFPVGDDLIGGTQDNGTWTSFNNSATFNSVLGGDGSYCAVHQQDGKTLYAGWQNGILRRSDVSVNPVWKDIDNTLKNSGDGFWFINPFDINPSNGDDIYYPTKKRIWRSLDKGNSWQAITNSIVGNIYAVAITKKANPTVYFAGQSSLLYRIDEAKTAAPGSEFVMTSLAPSAARNGFIGNIEINPADESTIYLSMNNVSTNSRLWKVWNANTSSPSWVDISGNLPSQLPVNWVQVDAKDTNLIIAATDFGLYTTFDGGTTWLKEKAIPNVTIPMIKLRDSDGQLTIYTHGRGVWTANTRTEPINTGLSAKKKSEVSIYPNPADEYFTVKGSEMVKTITLYNLQGAIVRQSAENRMFVADLPKGQYVVQSIFGDGTVVSSRIVCGGR